MTNRADSPTRQCSEGGCEKPLRGRGLCSTHYNQKHQPDRHKTHRTDCIVCGVSVQKQGGGGRKYGNVCSNECRRQLSFGDSVELPPEHWARWYGKSSPIVARCCIRCDNPFVSRYITALYCSDTCRKSPGTAARFTNGVCGECGRWFTAETHGSGIEYCTATCRNRVNRRARRAREHEAIGSYRFVEIMRLYMVGGKRCAYCDQPFPGLPEPEHVVPLSRGGRNDLVNLLPACRPCNSEKQDMTPTEWALWRMERGKTPRRSSFPATDPRFRHLVLATAIGLPHLAFVA